MTQRIYNQYVDLHVEGALLRDFHSIDGFVRELVESLISIPVDIVPQRMLCGPTRRISDSGRFCRMAFPFLMVPT